MLSREVAKWLEEAVFFSIELHPVLRYCQEPSSQKHYESTIWSQNKFISQVCVLVSVNNFTKERLAEVDVSAILKEVQEDYEVP